MRNANRKRLGEVLSKAAEAGACGLAGVVAGHWAVLAARRLTGDADIWLKGEHGPPFFELTLATGVYFACLGAGLGSGRARLRAALASGAASFAALAAPMMAGTRLFRWGEDSAEPTRAWVYLVLGSYAAACAAGVYAAAAATEAGGWRLGLKALAAAFAAWVIDRWVVASLPFKGLLPLAGGLLPPPATVGTGALWGLALGLAVSGKSAGGGR